jgi:hypothetical protein
MKGRPPAPHGTAGRYKSKKYACRCQPCSAAMAAYTQTLKENRKREAENPDDPRHGTRSFYTNYGCRCERCTQANKDYFAGRQA